MEWLTWHRGKESSGKFSFDTVDTLMEWLTWQGEKKAPENFLMTPMTPLWNDWLDTGVKEALAFFSLQWHCWPNLLSDRNDWLTKELRRTFRFDLITPLCNDWLDTGEKKAPKNFLMTPMTPLWNDWLDTGKKEAPEIFFASMTLLTELIKWPQWLADQGT